MLNIAIIGAGASGLFLMKKLARQANAQIYVFEKGKHVGAKLRASGGGKANIFNAEIQPDGYNHPVFIKKLLQCVNPEKMRSEFENMGLTMITDEEGRVYPSSQFSQTVLNVLLHPTAANVHIVLEHEVRCVHSANGLWQIDDYPVFFDKVVFASGSPANMIDRNRRNYNAYLTDFNLKSIPQEPSLVGFRISHYDKSLAGCRTKAIVSLYWHRQLIHREKGEVLFKEDGISGIVIMNMSAYYNRLPDRRDCELALNFLYFNENFDLLRYKHHFGDFRGLLHPKLHALYERSPFDVKKLKLPIDGVYDMAYAQVCHGGIALDEINDKFSLTRYPGISMTGELLDIDGVSGGYNLFFAFASALVVASEIEREIDEKRWSVCNDC